MKKQKENENNINFDTSEVVYAILVLIIFPCVWVFPQE